MVTTRTKQPSIAVERYDELNITSKDLSARLELPSEATNDAETIGSRLRKRRRTGSPTLHEPSTKPKRSSLQNSLSPVRKRSPPASKRTTLVSSGTLSTEKLGYSGHTRSASGHKRSSSDKKNPRNRAVKENTPPKPESGSHISNDDETESASSGSTITLGASPTVELASQTTRQTNLSASPSNLPRHESPLKQTPQTELPFLSNGAELQAVIQHIINHGQSIDDRRGSAEDDAAIDIDTLYSLGASVSLKSQSLPILDNLATQVLHTLAKSTYPEILTIVLHPESDSGQAYATLKSLFDHTKKVYTVTDSFLNIYELGTLDQPAIETLRKSNLATFVSSLFGSQDVGFYLLNEFFLDTFVADGNRLLKSQAGLFLELKTRAYISALSNGGRPREEILYELFPPDLEQRLLDRRPGAKQLAPSEIDFVNRARNRCQALLEEPHTEKAMAALAEKYSWDVFLRDVSAYISKNFETIVGVPAARKVSRARTPSVPPPDQQITTPQQQQAQIFRHQQQDQQNQHQIQIHNQSIVLNGHNQGKPVLMETSDIAEKAAQAAHFAMQGMHSQPMHLHPHPPPQYAQPPPHAQHPGLPQQPQFFPHQHPPTHQFQVLPHHPPPPHHPGHPPAPQPPFQYQFQHHGGPFPPPPPGYYNPHVPPPHMHPNHPPPPPGHVYADANGIPFPTQTAPTQVLYERARQAASSKSQPASRRSGTPSQRRPWTTDEENALMAGLDRVKGPHWSQILAMFGPGGTVNESLKDRNQVQLKDKARNLKLFFLKSCIEVPYYLQFVTGELKTRAPTQHPKPDDKGHAEAVFTLAGGSGGAQVDGVSDTAAPVDGQASGAAGIAAVDPAAMLPSQGELLDGLAGHATRMNGAHTVRNGAVPVVNGTHVPASSTSASAQTDGAIGRSVDGDAQAHATDTADADSNGERRLSDSLVTDAAAEAARAIALLGRGGTE